MIVLWRKEVTKPSLTACPLRMERKRTNLKKFFLRGQARRAGALQVAEEKALGGGDLTAAFQYLKRSKGKLVRDFL